MIDAPLLIESLPSLFVAALTSIQVALGAAAIGLSFGTALGLTQALAPAPWRQMVGCYVTVIRGTPMLIHLFAIFYVLPQCGIQLSPLWAAICAIGLNSAAYVSQIMRAGVQAVPAGQLQAARLLGLPFFVQLRHLILPQAVRFSWPTLGNEMVTLVKDSSLASIIGVMELSKQGALLRSSTYDAFTILLGVAIVYLMMTSLVQVAWTQVEKRKLRLC